MQRLRARKGALCGGVLLGAVSVSAATENLRAQAENAIEISTRHMSLDSALRSFAHEYAVQIIFPPENVRDREAPPIVGVHDLAGALDLLLEDTGLEYAFVSDSFVVVKVRAGGPARSRTADVQLTPENALPGRSGLRAGGLLATGEVFGAITSHVTGDSLAGASVSIPEIDIKTHANENGEYSLRDVPAGRHKVRVSYYGVGAEEYVIEVKPGERSEMIVSLGEQAPDIIYVTGMRGANSNSVNRHRASENIVSVLAADLSGRYPDDTIAEALRRAPGLSFERDERGGEGQFVSIRGIDTALNTMRINGQLAPAIGLGGTRRVPLDSFQTDAVSTLVVHKTLLPHHPSVGVGGVVDINTVAPTKNTKQEFSLTAEGRHSDFSDRKGFFLNAAYSDRLGQDETIGVYVSASFRRRFLRTYQVDVLGSFFPKVLPLGPDGAPIDDPEALAPDLLAPSNLSRIEDMRLNVFDDRRDILSVSGGLGWRVASHTDINLTGTINQRNIDTTRSTTSFEQRDDYSDSDVVTGELIDPSTGRFFFQGDRPFVRSRAEIEDQDREFLIGSLEARTSFTDVEIRYGAGAGRGSERIPLSTEIDFNTDDRSAVSDPALTADPLTGAQFFLFDISDPRFPAPNFTDGGLELIADPGSFQFRDVEIQSTQVRDRNYRGFVDVDYAINTGPLRVVRFGLEYVHSERRENRLVLFDDDNVASDGFVGGDGVFTLDQTGLLTGRFIDLAPIGNPFGGFPGVFEADRAGVERFSREVLASSGGGSLVDEDSYFVRSVETALSGYGAVELEVARNLVLTGGFRVEEFRGRYKSSRVIEIEGEGVDLEFRADPLRDNHRRTFEFLPRVALDYRPNDRLVFKAGMFEAIARPSYDALSHPESVEIDLDSGSAVIDAGDAAIPNITARNFDLSVQYFNDAGSYFEINGYYKKLSQFRVGDSDASVAAMPAGVNDLVDRLPEGFEQAGVDIGSVSEISFAGVVEGVSASAYGVDFSFLHQFDDAAPVLSGIGFRLSGGLQYTNFTLDTGRRPPRDLEFLHAPRFAGAASFWYQKYGLNAYAVYSYQGRQLNSIEELFPDEFVQPYSALDLRIEYQLSPRRKFSHALYVAASDVLDSGRKETTYETIGAGQRLLDDIEFNGREIRFGFRARY